MFDVQIEVFEGPFDLLLQLIMRQELDIHEVPVSQITSAYLAHLKDISELDLDGATEFLVIAATLLLIKTRSLLPAPEEEGEEEPESARQFLVERLIEYKKFQAASLMLEERYNEHGWYVPSLKEMESDYAELYPDPFEDAAVEELGETLVELLLERARQRVDTSYIAPIRVSVAEQLERVRSRLRQADETTFSELVAECRSKIEVIATFLAMLELYKRGELTFRQRRLFGEISVKRLEGEKSGVA